jgi:hypothetical protein
MHRNLTDKELVQCLHDKRLYSPIIEELCKRLESKIDDDFRNENEDLTISCPICSANMSIEFTDAENGVETTVKAIK